MSIEVKKGQEIIRKLRDMRKGLTPNDPELARMLHSMGIAITARAKSNIIRQRLVDTGALLNSIIYRAEMTNKGGRVTVGSAGVIYARIHEFGGEIHANNPTGYLRFKTRDGSWVTTESVTIPARPYLWPAMQDSVPYVRRLLDAHMKGKRNGN